MNRFLAPLLGIGTLIGLTAYWLLRPVTLDPQAMPDKAAELLPAMFVYYTATLVALMIFVWRLVKQGQYKWLSYGLAILACLVSLVLNELLTVHNLSSAGGILPFKLAAPNLVILFLNILVDLVPPRGWQDKA